MDRLAAGPLTGVEQKDGLDTEAALVRVGGDLELLKEIARIFLDDCPRSLAELHAALESQDCAGVERSAHTLKGASANFGANRLVFSALQLEKMGHAHTLDESAVAMAAVESALRALTVELEAFLAS